MRTHAGKKTGRSANGERPVFDWEHLWIAAGSAGRRSSFLSFGFLPQKHLQTLFFFFRGKTDAGSLTEGAFPHLAYPLK